MADFQIKTKNGYDFFEVSSAFQKSIRRCDENETMFWAVELYVSNYAKYLWKRMLIMTSEDVGLAAPGLPSQIIALKQSYDYLLSLKDKHTPEVLPFIHALLLLVRSKKSRFVDLAFSVYWDNHNKAKNSHDVPDYSLDMHTRRGKKLGRGLEHFYKEGALVNNKADIPLETEFEKLAEAVDIAAKSGKSDETNIEPDDSGKLPNPQQSLFDPEKQRTERRDH